MAHGGYHIHRRNGMKVGPTDGPDPRQAGRSTYIAIEKPPSTGIAVPVTKLDASLARNAATPDMSRGTPQRPSGVRFSTLSCSPVTCCRARFVRSVSIHPGSTALTWILSLAHAVASARVIWTMPPLELA